MVIKAACSYEVEVEADDETEAEDKATGMWREHLPDDFQVEKGYITDWEAEDIEQLSWECSECDKEISQEESTKNDGICNECNAEHEAEEQASL